MKGKPEYGINQQEKSFDYERFIPPTIPPTIPPPAETQDYGDFNSEEIFGEFDEVMNDSNPTNETLLRASRNYFNNQKYIRRSDINTVCPDKVKRLYESNRLSCTNLRNIIINYSNLMLILQYKITSLTSDIRIKIFD